MNRVERIAMAKDAALSLLLISIVLFNAWVVFITLSPRLRTRSEINSAPQLVFLGWADENASSLDARVLFPETGSERNVSIPRDELPLSPGDRIENPRFGRMRMGLGDWLWLAFVALMYFLVLLVAEALAALFIPWGITSAPRWILRKHRFSLPGRGGYYGP